MEERRKYPRYGCPLDGSWRGGAGGSTCRVGDISLGGCFVLSQSCPEEGEEAVITMTLADGGQLSLPGTVIHAMAGLGFAVEFASLPADTRVQLVRLIQDLPRKPSTI